MIQERMCAISNALHESCRRGRSLESLANGEINNLNLGDILLLILESVYRTHLSLCYCFQRAPLNNRLGFWPKRIRDL